MTHQVQDTMSTVQGAYSVGEVARILGASKDTVRQLTGPTQLPCLHGQWPPYGFTPDETGRQHFIQPFTELFLMMPHVLRTMDAERLAIAMHKVSSLVSSESSLVVVMALADLRSTLSPLVVVDCRYGFGAPTGQDVDERGDAACSILQSNSLITVLTREPFAPMGELVVDGHRSPTRRDGALGPMVDHNEAQSSDADQTGDETTVHRAVNCADLPDWLVLALAAWLTMAIQAGKDRAA